MNATKLVRQLLDKTYHYHRVPASIKAKAVLLYFRGMSLRDARKYLSDEYTLWVYVDETKIKIFLLRGFVGPFGKGCSREVVFLYKAQAEEVLQEVSLEC